MRGNLEVKRHRFTAREYCVIGEAGVLGEDDRVELVDGEIVDMAPIGSRHLSCVVALTHLLVERAQGRYFVSVHNPVRLSERDEPQPDLTLCLGDRPERRQRRDTFRTGTSRLPRLAFLRLGDRVASSIVEGALCPGQRGARVRAG